MRIRVATRGSELALWQARHVVTLLEAVEPELEAETVVVTTRGDRDQDTAISRIGGKGVFVKEVQAAVLDGRADLAVHSAKDLPTLTPEGLVLAAVPGRGDPRDALVGARLEELGPGACVATGSARRRVQIAALRPDLTFAELRGNIATRLAGASRYGAVVVAAAALSRLDRLEEVSEILEPRDVLPQVGQGALAVECRSDADALCRLAGTIEHEASRSAVDAERSFLAELGGDCDLPAGAHAIVDESGDLSLDGMVASLDGHVLLRERRCGTDPEVLGRAVARFLLDDAGGASLLPSGSGT